MATTIVTKNSSTLGLAPSAGQLVQGELAVNVTDKKIYTLNSSGTVVLLSSGSDFTIPVTVTVNSSLPAVTITQTGTGAALLVEDSANPDSTPFVVDATGNMGVGTLTPTAKVNIIETTTQDALRITNTGTGNSFVVEDAANPDSTPFVVDASGRLLIGQTSTYVVDSSGSTPLVQISTAVGPASYEAIKWNAASVFPLRPPAIRLAVSDGASTGTQGVVVDNRLLGSYEFYGSDGTTFIKAASITSSVDGTPGTNDMPGRLAFSTTADGASTPTERMRITSAGFIGVGSTNPSVGNGVFRITQSLTGGVNAYGVYQASTVQSDVTTTSIGIICQLNTAAAAFNITNLRQFQAIQGVIGAGSTITNQIGFVAEATLIGAANNFGFWGNVPNATQRTVTTVARTTNVVTITTSVAHGFTAGQQVTIAAVTNTSLNGTFVIASVPTTSSLTYAQTGTDIISVADTGTVNSAGRYNFYANGTAPNYFGGKVGIGTSDPLADLYVSGNAAQNIAALTDAATIAVDMSTANNFSVTLGGSRTLGNPTGLIAGQSGVIYITQDGTGSKTLAYSSFWDFSGGAAPTLTTTANAVDALVYTVRTSTAIVATLITNVG